MLLFAEFRRIRKTYIQETRIECRKVWQKYIHQKKALEMKFTETSPTGSVCAGSVCTTDGWIFPATTLSSYGEATNMNHTHSFADCTKPQPPFHDMFPEPAYYQQEGINPMNYATATVQAATTETQDQRKYLERRLQDVYSQKRDGLEAAFGLVDDEAPNGPGELSERLKEGKFTIRGLDKDKGTQFNYWCWFDLIQWRDPSRKEDAEGFKKAVDELKALRQKSLDSIKIEDVKAGLDAVKALEAWTPTGAAN